MLVTQPVSGREYSNPVPSGLRVWMWGWCTHVSCCPAGSFSGQRSPRSTHMLWDLCLGLQGQVEHPCPMLGYPVGSDALMKRPNRD